MQSDEGVEMGRREVAVGSLGSVEKHSYSLKHDNPEGPTLCSAMGSKDRMSTHKGSAVMGMWGRKYVVKYSQTHACRISIPVGRIRGDNQELKQFLSKKVVKILAYKNSNFTFFCLA